jgi:hypothetical protein
MSPIFVSAHSCCSCLSWSPPMNSRFLFASPCVKMAIHRVFSPFSFAEVASWARTHADPVCSQMPTRHGTSRTTLGRTCVCTSRTTRADLASPTTPSPDVLHRTQRTPGLLPSWAPLPAPVNRSGCRATTSRIQPPGCPPLSAISSKCTMTSYSTMTAQIRWQQHSLCHCLVQAAALLQTRLRHRCCKCRRQPADSARRCNNEKASEWAVGGSLPCHLPASPVLGVWGKPPAAGGSSQNKKCKWFSAPP